MKISEGCKKRCAFCAIPLIRGNLQSRSIRGCPQRSETLVAGGVKELIIISHDFTDYGWDLKKSNAAAVESPYELLKTLSDQSGAEWIRVLYLYPDGVTDEMIELIRGRKNLVKYFDIPLQHINNDVLKTMNRRMTREIIGSVLAKFATGFRTTVIRTQFIVGYPGETEEQFQELLAFIKEQEFDRVGCFIYSQEEGTKAGGLPGQVDLETKQRRHDELMALQQEISRKKHSFMVGKVLPVLVEGFSEETELLLVGRHTLQAPDMDGLTYINDGTAKVGEIVQVLVNDAHDYDLVGAIVPSSPH